MGDKKTIILMGQRIQVNASDENNSNEKRNKGDKKAIILMGQHIQVNASDENNSNEKQTIMNEASMENNTNKTIESSGPSGTSKKKRSYKKRNVKSTQFPEDVKSLLTTNIFNCVPVAYVSWSREKQLKGLIHGNGFVCSCKSCDSYKVVKSNVFEAHAGCKTKHPNNNIYFPNGKSIHEVVTKLRKTPRENLCEAIEELTEGQVNEVNFRKWKVKYEAGKI